MSLVKNVTPDPEEIINYLRSHPDFFVKYPEILSSLHIPHITDNNISSLIEYQVLRLREQINNLQGKKGKLQQHSDANRLFAENTHKLSLQLLCSDNLDELYNILYKGLKTFYSANRVLLFIFTGKKMKPIRSDIRFLSSVSNLNFMFTELFHRNKPLCGSLQEEHLKVLFEKDIEKIKSTVLLPMSHKDWQGLLILGSARENYYSHGFDLDMLVYLKDILHLSLQKFLIAGNR